MRHIVCLRRRSLLFRMPTLEAARRGMPVNDARGNQLLSPVPSRDAKRLREFFSGVGYTEDNLRGTMGMKDLPSSRLRNYARLLDRTSEPNCINTLVRWFWIGTSQQYSEAEGF